MTIVKVRRVCSLVCSTKMYRTKSRVEWSVREMTRDTIKMCDPHDNNRMNLIASSYVFFSPGFTSACKINNGL